VSLPRCRCVNLKLVANQTLHRPQREHTEIEEELHEKAHIDYDRVSIVRIHNVYLAYVTVLIPYPGRQPLGRRTL
jgi:hypothetical protein